MSASSRPTFLPAAAMATARFTVTDDLPTPPLPLATAYTLVSESGWANGMTRCGWPPRSVACSSLRCCSLITSSSTRTRRTPSSLLTAAVTSRVMVSRSGQPATVRKTSTRTVPSRPTSTFLTMPRSVIGRWISGSLTPASAWVTCSIVGGDDSADVIAMPPMLRSGQGHVETNGRPGLNGKTLGVATAPALGAPGPREDAVHGGTAADRPQAPGRRSGPGHSTQSHRYPPAHLRGRGAVREQRGPRGRCDHRHVPVVPRGRLLRRGQGPQQATDRAGAPLLPDLGEDAHLPG